MAAPRIVLATRSTGKLRELGPLLSEAGLAGVTLAELGLAEEPAEASLEAYPTFRENATAKARHFVSRTGGGLVLAEDSGLCVDALGGAPGVYSKRWGGDAGLLGDALDAANNARLLAALADAGAEAPSARGAAYVCAAVLAWPGGEAVAEGRTAGWILGAPCGAGGFGYDPYFWSEELGACFGAVSSVEKGRVSHRARAVRAVLASWRREISPTR